jgi:hypothetical protein
MVIHQTTEAEAGSKLALTEAQVITVLTVGLKPHGDLDAICHLSTRNFCVG